MAPIPLIRGPMQTRRDGYAETWPFAVRALGMGLAFPWARLGMGEAVPLQSHGVSFVFSEMRLGIPIPMLLILKGRVFPEQSHGKCKAYAGQGKQFPLGRTLRT